VPVELTRNDEFALITLNRPEALNALSFDIVRDIGAAIDEVAGSDARALIITGAGDKAFCAGADIKEMVGRSTEAHHAAMSFGQRTFAKLDDLPMASVALINGYAFGGGLELAMACTFRLATPAAKMGQPEIKLGLIPGYGGTQRLPRLIGEARAQELILTGRTVGAEEAERYGLVNRIVEGDGLQAAFSFAREFSVFGLPALRAARSATARALDLPVMEGFKVEADRAALAYTAEDATEGMQAFIDKRKAEFKDR